jgi:hypothetical protein
MKNYVDYLSSTAKDHILPGDVYGDWASENMDGTWKRGEPLSTSTGFYYYTTDIVAKAAKILEHHNDAQKYALLASDIKNAWNERFLDEENNLYESGSQFSNTFPLFLDIVPEDKKDAVLSNLIGNIIAKKGHLSTGILGTKYMMELFSRENRSDIAYLIINQPDYPGWNDMLRYRTTLSEHWNQGGSNNHVMFGSIDAWFYKVLAGINIDDNAPGFKNIIIKPYMPAQMLWVKASVNTIRGIVKSEWILKENQYRLKIEIPVNSTATVYILAKDQNQVKEGEKSADHDKRITFLRMEGKYAVYHVESGNYDFTSRDVYDLIDRPYVSNPKISPGDTVIYKPDKIAVKMTSETEGAEIRYTIDGSGPTEVSRLYKDPIILDTNTVISARAYKKDYNPSFSQSVAVQFVDSLKNGVKYKLYEGAWTKLPDFARLKPIREGIIFNFGLKELDIPKYEFAIHFKSYIKTDVTGEYKFYTKSNDGSQLFIGDKLVVDNDEEHGVEERSGTIYLTAGRHPIEVTYFQSGGSMALKALYEGPGIDKQMISPIVLFQQQ